MRSYSLNDLQKDRSGAVRRLFGGLGTVMGLLAALCPVGSLAAQATPGGGDAEPVVVASKPFGENYLLAEMFSQLLEARGIPVDRRPGLGATEIAFQAVRTGSVDIYPEYTGTGLVAILGAQPESDEEAVFRRVATEFPERFGVYWLPGLGFQNTYAIAVRRETAERFGLETLSDLAAIGGQLTAGLSPDFIGRDDGLPRLQEVYGLEMGSVRPLLQAVKYRALAAGEVDVIDGYSTDGLISRYDLVILEDDRGAFPAYEAAPLVSSRLFETRPEAIAALVQLAGRLDEPRMRELNRRVEADGEEIDVVARDALSTLGLISGGATRQDDRRTADSGLAAYLWARRAEIGSLTLRHLMLVGISLGAAILLAVSLGVLLERWGSGAEPFIRGVGVIQTIPGIALLAFMIPLLGIGAVPAILALFLYSLYPILRNTYTGVRDASPAAVNAARAMGMHPGQVLWHVRLPLAVPTIMAGIRTAAVINVGTATLAAFIGAGGLGDPIVSGLALSDTRMILSGAIPAGLLALAVDALLAAMERVATPRGLEIT